MNPEYREITKEDLKTYESLMLPMVYEELNEQDEINDYICIASWLNNEPAGVLIAELEESGDINLLSIWTEPKYRRMGVASALHEKMNTVAVNLYDWEEGQYGDDILIKTMYCLSPKYREVFEAWLEANDYTDFCILRDESPDTPEICSATAEVHFFRTGE